MGKRLVPILALLAMLMPVAGFALGLGSITMNSALNQPLDAEIELLSVQRGDLDNLVVRLGAQQDFDRVGAERSFFLTKIKFAVEKKPNGTPYIRLTSSQTVTEPFLDFVVEARWPRGRVLREFTVLVDPPTLVEEAPAPVQQAATAAQPEPQSEPEVRTINDEAFFQPAPTRGRAAPAPAQSQQGDLAYGPVKYSDTLYGIANQLRPQGVSINQMMVTLVRDNPQAFYHNNINEMKAGYVLRVEDRQALSELTSRVADAEVRRQTDEWRARKSGKLVQQAEAPAAGRVERGESSASMGEQASSASTAEDQARLKLVAPGSEGSASGAGGEDVDQLRQDLLLAAEALDANRQETEDLKSRLMQMEEQMVAMQRLILLKDNEMATLQQQLSGDQAAQAPGMMEEAAGTEAAMTGEQAMEATPDAMAEQPVEQQAAAPAPAPQMAPAPVATNLLDQTMEQVMEVVEDPMSILEKPILLYGALAIILILLLGLLIARRRSMKDGFEESILNVGGAAAAASGAPSVGESSMVSDFAMSDMSDMSGIQADAAEVDPISEADVYLAYGRHQQAEDIIREAMKTTPDRHELKVKMLEVHFAAKNREAFEQQAQELHDTLGDESDPLWARAVTMGHQLCPGNELFGGVSADTLKEELASGADASDEDLLDFDFDLDTAGLDESVAETDDEDDIFADIDALTTSESEPSASTDHLDFGGEESTASDLDFDMGEGALEVVEAAAPEKLTEAQPTPEAERSSLDFDVSSLDFNLDETISASDLEEAEQGIEFSLGDATTEPASAVKPEVVESAGEEFTSVIDDLGAGLDFDLVESVEKDEDTDEIVMNIDDEALSFEETLGDTASEDTRLDMDLGELSLDESTVGEDDLDLEVGGLALEDVGEEIDVDLGDELTDDVFGEVDEVGTKLDLARAYVDMGDQDGARNILNEVIEEGDADQKSQAQELLEKIG